MSQNHDELDVLKEESKDWKMDQQRKEQMRQTLQQYAQKKQKRQKRQRWMVAGIGLAATVIFMLVVLSFAIGDDVAEPTGEAPEKTVTNGLKVHDMESVGSGDRKRQYRIVSSIEGEYESFTNEIKSENGQTYDFTINERNDRFIIELTIPEDELPSSGVLYWHATIDGETESHRIEEFPREDESTEGEPIMVELVSEEEETIVLEGMEEKTTILTYRITPYNITYSLEEFFSNVSFPNEVVTHRNRDATTGISIKIQVSENGALEEVKADWQSEIESLGEADLSTYDTALEGTHYAGQGEGYVIGELGEDVVVIEYEFPMEAGDGFWPRFEQLLETIEKES
ncbi:hypothetical protein ACKXGF_02195 [Alkalibacillus sp. S2W]|uniref:hypothetical protein n=1 Tax=Alkalibacillus sp. S2W TaxID=3386553 RepID=UPI00398C9485